MDKTKIFGIGISGLVGSSITRILRDQYIFDNLSLDTGIDITDPKTLEVIRQDQDHSVVLHLAAKADVDGCEQDKTLGKDGLAYKINVDGVKNVADACKEGNKKMIYISTDFVFDGQNTPKDGYTEDDKPNPINWYAQTKYEGEEVVRNSGLPYLIVRIAYPFQKDDFALKKDFVHAMLGRLQNNQPIAGVTDHIMTPTYLDDLAYALDALIKQNAVGTFHVVGSEFVTPYDVACKIAETFGLNTSLISKSTREEYFQGKAPRPFNLSLNNAKIKKLGVRMRGFSEGLQELK